MSNKHEAYDIVVEKYADEKISYIFLDIHEELDNIGRTLESESSKILLNWVRDAMTRVAESYKQ